MSKLLISIDGSQYADAICANAAWAAKRMNASIDVLHVLRPNSEYQVLSDDYTGAIGMDARRELRDALSQVDEARGKLDRQKGQLILAHGERILNEAGITKINMIHRRGSFSDIIKDLEKRSDMIFIGKRGEEAKPDSEFLGSNLEKIIRIVHNPIVVVSRFIRPISRFVIAYDGKENANKAVNFVASSALLKGLDCHLLMVNQSSVVDTKHAVETLSAVGFNVVLSQQKAEQVDQAIAAYVRDAEMDLVLAGAYSHSRMRNLLLGSTTGSIISACPVSLILFR